MIEPVDRKSLSDSVFEQLRQRIVSGQLPAGDPLPSERKLCEMLQVNRGALREALKRLEQANLVSIRHGGGTTVRDFRRSGGLDLLAALLLRPDGTVNLGVARGVIELRQALAPEIARSAALHADPNHVRALRQVLREMEEADGDLDRLQQLGLDLWQVLVDASGNVAYQLAYNSLRETYSRIREVLQDLMAGELTDLTRMAALVDAVAAGNPEDARREAQTFIDASSASFMKLMDQQGLE